MNKVLGKAKREILPYFVAVNNTPQPSNVCSLSLNPVFNRHANDQEQNTVAQNSCLVSLVMPQSTAQQFEACAIPKYVAARMDPEYKVG